MLCIKVYLLLPDMGRCEITRGRQALELRSNLSERRSLTDRIQTSGCSESYSARNLQWAVAHGTLSIKISLNYVYCNICTAFSYITLFNVDKFALN